MEVRARWKESKDGKGGRRPKINNFTFCGHSSIVGPTEYKWSSEELLHFMWGCSMFPPSIMPAHFQVKFKGKVANNWVTITISCSTWVFLEVSHWPYLTYEAMVQGREAAKNTGHTHTHTHTHTLTHSLTSALRRYGEEKSSLLGKLYLDIKPQPQGP